MRGEAAVNRVEPIRAEEAEGEAARLFEGARKLLGRVANSFAVMGHQPHVARMILPLTVTLMREGLGTVLPTRIKEMAVIKTSHLNGCEY